MPPKPNTGPASSANSNSGGAAKGQPPKASAPAAPAATSVESKPTTKVPAPASATAAISHDMIAKLAYEKWRQRGGDPVGNWLEAERELRAGR